MSTKDNEPRNVSKPVKSLGYRMPPEPNRFKKGISGNPKGRPKGSLNLTTVVIKILSTKIIINQNGQRKTVTKLEAVLMQMTNKAVSGDPRARRDTLEFARYVEATQNATGAQNPVIEELDREVIDGIVQRLNAREEDTRELQEDIREGNDVDNQHS